ncbi:MAG: ABC transporter permease [Thermomicrobiales bacterium]
MFLAIRELRYAKLRYLLIGAIMTLIAWLAFLLSGLANGLATDNAAAISTMPTNYFVFQHDARLQLTRSLLPFDLIARVKAVPGITDAAPLGQMMLAVKRSSGGDQLDAAMLGIDPTSFIAPPITSGTGLVGAPANGVVVDKKLADKGVGLGDTLIVQPTGQQLTVVGFTNKQTYSHQPVIFAPLATWQQIRFATPGAAGNITNPISAVALKGNQDAADRVAGALTGVQVASRGETVKTLPGYSEESGTLSMIQGFLFVIAAFIIAAFFYILTLQKTAQFGVLKAIGASTSFLARDLLGQVVLLTVTGIATGAALAYGVSLLIPQSVPFALESALVLGYGAVLLAVALGGALLSLRRIATTDALVAIGRAD